MTLRFSSTNKSLFDMKSGRIFGLPEGYDAHLMLDFIALTGRSVLHVGRDDRRLEATRDTLGLLSPETRLIEFPAWDCPPFSRISPRPEVVSRRIGALAGSKASSKGSPSIVLTTANALAQRVPPQFVFGKSTFTAKLGQNLDHKKFLSYLQLMGYGRSPRVIVPGEFAVRGGLIDVFPPGRTHPVRLDFFGDKLDGIRLFSAATQRTEARLERVSFFPVSEVVLDSASVERFRKNYRSEFGVPERNDEAYISVTEGRWFAGIEHWLPFFYDRTETVLDYFSDAIVLLDEGLDAAIKTRWDEIQDAYSARREPRDSGLGQHRPYMPCPPHLMYIEPAGLETILAARPTKRLLQTGMVATPGAANAQGELGHRFVHERRFNADTFLGDFCKYLKVLQPSKKVVIACWTPASLERMHQILKDEGIGGVQLIDDLPSFLERGSGLGLTVWRLAHGYSYHGVSIITEQDIFGDRISGSRTRTSPKNTIWSESSGFKTGELVVHSDHGIGRYVGLQSLNIETATHDCLVLEYAEGARLFIPVESIDVLSRYGLDSAPLDRLGAAAWQERKARLKKKLLEIAAELINVAAKRELAVAPKLPRDPLVWDAFISRFVYEETDEQNNAVEDVLSDLESGRPMDRLICGDVGFGKTEVAMRATLVAAMAGFQVAVLAPTTLLARQHFETFTRRFRGFPIEIGHMSRIVSPRRSREVKNRTSEGLVDVLIGTHALLSKSLNFKNLGLVIVDEEQNFGVTHKETLKHLRTDIHVLSMTATPIPRTMQMAFSGVRDMSIISTPPADRLSVRTYVAEFDATDVRQALLRERFRGGQCFVVVPRIRDISRIEEFLKESVPEIRYTVAHGRLKPSELKERMQSFYSGKCDTLLSTNIVASGLDVPTANTIIIYDAIRFGLAQLHQLRGRVGRSNTRAYAFITYLGGRKLTEQSRERLRLLGSIESLGAGFTLASHDLDIRGGGNVLGGAQSGHIREVGQELYQRMLEQAVKDLKANSAIGTSQLPDDDWIPQLNIGLDARIPETYVEDLDTRLGLYRRMAAISNKDELADLASELRDRFGELPSELQIFLRILGMKQLCKKTGISRLDCGPKGARIWFQDDRFPNPAGLMNFIKSQHERAKVRGNSLIVRRNWHSDLSLISGALEMLKDLTKFSA